MQKGFWNYTEPVEYRGLLVTLQAVTETPLHWQNAFIGEGRQILEIIYSKIDAESGETYSFYIDNEDGSGLLKLEARGGPGSMSRHVKAGAFEILEEVAAADLFHYDPWKCKLIDEQVSAYQKREDPQEFAKLEKLRASWQNSPHKKAADEARKKAQK